jgi:hypothetical protein
MVLSFNRMIRTGSNGEPKMPSRRKLSFYISLVGVITLLVAMSGTRQSAEVCWQGVFTSGLAAYDYSRYCNSLPGTYTMNTGSRLGAEYGFAPITITCAGCLQAGVFSAGGTAICDNYQHQVTMSLSSPGSDITIDLIGGGTVTVTDNRGYSVTKPPNDGGVILPGHGITSWTITGGAVAENGDWALGMSYFSFTPDLISCTPDPTPTPTPTPTPPPPPTPCTACACPAIPIIR